MNLREKAYCLALKPVVISKYCSKCVKSETECKLSRCGSCKTIHYCCTECQKSDWPLHKIECSAIKTSKETGHESYRLVLRMHSKSKGAPQPQNESTKRTFSDLIWHPSVTTAHTDYNTWKEDFRRFCSADINDEKLAELYGKMSVNCFALTNQYTIEIGLALCIQLSAIDHSCKPKARIAFLGDEAIMVPTGDFSAELTIDRAQHSYINEMMPKEMRRKNLKERYNFECNCDGCRDETRERNMTGYECENCANCVEIGGVCKVCNFKMSPDQTDLCNLNKEMADATVNALLKSGDSGKQETRLQICQKALEVMEGVLYKYNILRFIVLRHAFAAAISLKELTPASKYGSELLNIQQFYQSPNDLSLISLKYSLANLSLRRNSKSTALQYLNEIKPRLIKIYGLNTLVVTDVDHMIAMAKS